MSGLLFPHTGKTWFIYPAARPDPGDPLTMGAGTSLISDHLQGPREASRQSHEQTSVLHCPFLVPIYRFALSASGVGATFDSLLDPGPWPQSHLTSYPLVTQQRLSLRLKLRRIGRANVEEEFPAFVYLDIVQVQWRSISAQKAPITSSDDLSNSTRRVDRYQMSAQR